jgi:hypothetical protein
VASFDASGPTVMLDGHLRQAETYKDVAEKSRQMGNLINPGSY